MQYNILDFGAVSDGKTVNSAAVQSAIDSCSSAGGGAVIVPAGIFKIGTIWLKSRVELHLERGAVLLASENLEDYNADDAYPQNFSFPPEEWNFKHLILAIEVSQVSITGDGVIDGNCSAFFAEPVHWSDYQWRDGLALSKDKKLLRPGQLISFIECNNIRIENITVRNSTCWVCHFYGCEYVTTKGIKIFNPPNAANTDGIDIDASRFVTVSDCIIDTGDDAIAIRSCPHRLKNKNMTCEYVTVNNCVLSSSSAVFRVGVGTDCIKHIKISNIVCKRGGTCIYMEPNHSSTSHTPLEDITFSNISAYNVAFPIHFLESGGTSARFITIENCRFSALAGIDITALTPGAVSDISLRNIDYILPENSVELNEKNLAERGNTLIRCKGIERLTLDNITLFPDPNELAKWNQIYEETNCRNIKIRNSSFCDDKN